MHPLSCAYGWKVCCWLCSISSRHSPHSSRAGSTQPIIFFWVLIHIELACMPQSSTGECCARCQPLSACPSLEDQWPAACIGTWQYNQLELSCGLVNPGRTFWGSRNRLGFWCKTVVRCSGVEAAAAHASYNAPTILCLRTASCICLYSCLQKWLCD